MSALFPILPFDQEETPISFTARLASLHIGLPILPFLRDIEVKAHELAGCKDDALERLAFVSGIELAELRRNAARSLGNRSFDLRGHVFSAEFFASPYTVFCPACLREDDRRSAQRARTPEPSRLRCWSGRRFHGPAD